MRTNLVLALVAGLVAFAPVSEAFAQRRDSGDAAAQKARQDAAKQKRMDEEQALDNLPLPDVVNAGPCPFVKVLYDASRYIDFKGRQSASTVVFSGELEGVTARCSYRGGDPIVVDLLPTFSFGRGPLADTPTRRFNYWVAVTDRNKSVISKEFFTVTPNFNGNDRVVTGGEQAQITIPRLNDQVSGANFEILVGFEITPQMAEFNRLGSRFMVTAAPTPAAAAAAAATGTPPAQ